MKNIIKKHVKSIFLTTLLISMVLIGNVNAKEPTNPETNKEIEGKSIELKTDLSSINGGSSAKLKAYLPNYIVVTIKPQAKSYKITITNIGVDRISKVNTKLTIYSNTGKLLASYTKYFRNLKVGNTTYTWMISKQNTVQEKIVFSGSASDGGQHVKLKSGSTVRYNFAGGKYGSLKAYDGQRHHMPSTYALGATSKVSTYSGPCIRMITAEHRKTASYGGSTSAKSFRNKEKKLVKQGKFLAAQKLGTSDIRKKFGIKYNVAINQMVSYTKKV